MSRPHDLSLLGSVARQGNLGEIAYESLKQSIIGGQFQPETKLTVRLIAQALEISTTPARDAINRLIGEGVLVNLGPKTVVVPRLTLQVLDEVTKIRLALEGLAAAEAVAYVQDEDTVFFEETQEKLNTALDEARYQDVLRLNKAFHFRLYGLSQMPQLVSMIESQWLRIGPSLNKLYPEFAIDRRGVSNHVWAMTGLKARDSATVKAAIENDLRDGYRSLVRLVNAGSAVVEA